MWSIIRYFIYDEHMFFVRLYFQFERHAGLEICICGSKMLHLQYQ